jgi:phage tail P2-like protein
MTTQSLLPRNTTPLERALETAMAKFDPAMQVPTLWNANTCPEQFLPWLAWALSVDDWETDWSEQKKRQACDESIDIHEHKGTPEAIMRALRMRGQPDAILIERSPQRRSHAQRPSLPWRPGHVGHIPRHPATPDHHRPIASHPAHDRLRQAQLLLADGYGL